MKRNQVGIETFRNKTYRLRLPRSIAAKGNRYISTKLPLSEANYRKAQRVALQIEEEIANSTLAPTLKRYKAEFEPKVKVYKSQSQPKAEGLSALWEQYAESRKPQVAETTFVKWYQQGFPQIIKKLPTQELTHEGAIGIRDHRLTAMSPIAPI